MCSPTVRVLFASITLDLLIILSIRSLRERKLININISCLFAKFFTLTTRIMLVVKAASN